MPEMIDLYDLNHQATGHTLPRGAAVPKDYCTMLVGFWVRDCKGRILLEQRSSQKRWFPSYWECGGGSAHAGETAFDAVVRELAEELGLYPTPSCWRLLGEFENKEVLENIYFHHWCLTYMVTLPEESPDLFLQDEEVQAARWLEPKELPDFMEQQNVTDYTRRMWARFSSQLLEPVPKIKKKS